MVPISWSTTEAPLDALARYSMQKINVYCVMQKYDENLTNNKCDRILADQPHSSAFSAYT